MNADLLMVLALLACAVAMFAINRPSSDVVGLLMILALPFTGVIEVHEALAGFADPNIVLIRVHVDHAEYWDVPSSVMVHAYGYLKAVTTGKPAHPGDVGAVRFD